MNFTNPFIRNMHAVHLNIDMLFIAISTRRLSICVYTICCQRHLTQVYLYFSNSFNLRPLFNLKYDSRNPDNHNSLFASSNVFACSNAAQAFT